MIGQLPFSSVDWRDEIQKLLHSQTPNVMAGMPAEDVLLPIVNLVLDRLEANLIRVWSVDPRREKLVLMLQESSSAFQPSEDRVVDLVSTFTGEAVEKRKPLRCILPNDRKRHAVSRRTLRRLEIKSYLSLPIRNIGNPHQITWVMDLFFPFVLPTFIESPAFIEEYRSFARLLATWLESNLRERALRKSARVSRELSAISPLTMESACATFAKSILEALKTDRVTIYLENWDGSKLQARGDVAAELIPNDVDSRIPQSVIRVWRSNRESLSPDTSRDDKHVNLVTTPLAIECGLLVPLHDVDGGCKGVVRCLNIKKSPETAWRRSFSYDDIAIVEAMERAFAPPLNQLLDLEKRDISLQNLGHELRVPLIALRAVNERMEREYRLQADFRFRFPYFTEVGTFTDVMQRLLRSLEIVQLGPERLEINKQPTRLQSELIAPSIRFLQPALRQRGMSTQQISYYSYDSLPIVEIDRALVTQIVFNILENAIKYFPRDRSPTDFAAAVVCEVLPEQILIHFEDNGPGIPKEDESSVFEYATRGRNAPESHVQGSGIGLWMCREIARRHGGDLMLSSADNPTRFTLRLDCPGLTPPRERRLD